MPLRSYRPEDYTVGWISALPIELSAALQMLDEEHQSLPLFSSSVSYVLGRIASYCVVIAWLPAGEYGTSSAAGVASDMTSRFPGLRFCLMVGIGGGVPSFDVRLGDVVVSQPKDLNGGVVQYDLGKSTAGGFERKGFLNAPPKFLRSLLSLYQARNSGPASRLSSTSHVFHYEVTRTILHPRPDEDLLFPANYEHKGGESCESCERSLVVAPNSRATAIHYGTIASGNQVIKTAKVRDSLSKNLGGVLCFEMEAAGVMNELPCLVIRGICDYADSHKNKEWQPYAAGIAAAYARELLCSSISDAHRQNQASEPAANSLVLRNFKTSLFSPSERTSADQSSVEVYGQDEESDLILIQRISSYNANDVLGQYLRLRCPGTAQWILKHVNFCEWVNGDFQACLSLDGKIGAGKTLLTSSIIESLLLTEQAADHKTTIVHYFFRRSHEAGLTAIALACSMVQQLLSRMREMDMLCPSDIMGHIRQVFSRKSPGPDMHNVYENILIPLISFSKGTALVMDGVDECESDQTDLIFELIEKLSNIKKVKILISGRESLDVSNRIPGSTNIRISEEDSFPDIRIYIKWKIAKMMRRRPITEDQTLLQSIHTSLERKADRMILWVYLQIESLWRDCFNDEEIVKALNHLPKNLEETYRNCLDRIMSNPNPHAKTYSIQILSWVLTAKKPLSLLELREALAIDTETGILNRQRIPTIMATLSCCANLIVLNDDTLLEREDDSDTCGYKDDDGRSTNNARILVVHHSLRQFLESPDDRHSFIDAIQPFLKDPIKGLASLCVKHLLSEDYALTVERATPNSKIILQSPRPEIFMGRFGSFIRPFTATVKPITLAIQMPRSTKMPHIALPAIFYYARDQWPTLTRIITENDQCFADFRTLVMQPNLTYRLHPWSPLGQSIESHHTALLAWAISNQHHAMLQLALNSNLVENLCVPIPQYGGYNSVLLAVQHDDMQTLRTIYRRYPDTILAALETNDEMGLSALHLAAQTGAYKIVNMLLSEIQIRYPSYSETTEAPLEIAVRTQHVGIATSLVEKLWNPSGWYSLTTNLRKATRELRSARYLAIEEGSCSVLEAMDSVTGPCRATSMNVWTRVFDPYIESFQHALNFSHPEILIYLLGNLSVSDTECLLECAKYACEHKSPALLEKVLQKQHGLSDFPVLEGIRDSELFESWYEWLRGKIPGAIQNSRSGYLLGEFKTKFGEETRHIRKTWVPNGRLQPRVELNGRMKQPDPRPRTPNIRTRGTITSEHHDSLIVQAITTSDLDRLIDLVSNGADVNGLEVTGQSPLHIAASRQTDNLDCLFYLLSLQEIDINLPDTNGNTALHLAIDRPHLEAVRLLLRHGADIFKKNDDGFSAYDLSHRSPLAKIRKLLSVTPEL